MASRLDVLVQHLGREAEKLSSLATGQDAISPSATANEPAEVAAARRELLGLAMEIQTLVQTPSDFLNSQQIHYQTLSCLRWLLRFNIFSQVPGDPGSISYSSLAAAASVPVGRLSSVARMAMTSGLFHEPRPGHIAHSALSAPFASAGDSSLRDWAQFITEYGQPTAAALADATQRWGDSVALNETAYNAAFDSVLPFFEDIKKRPGLADGFARYMKNQAQSDGLRHEHLVHGFDWAAHLGPEAHIVDVGGSNGFVAAALARAQPGFTMTVQDLPETISLGPEFLDTLPADVRCRISLVAHDFFSPQPQPQGLDRKVDADADADAVGRRPPDAYLLRKILHDWPAARARVILSHLAVALRDSGSEATRIIVMDTILPPPGTISRLHEARLRVRDVVMAQTFNSGERELDTWKELFASAEPKLGLVDWVQPAGSDMAIMVVKLAA